MATPPGTDDGPAVTWPPSGVVSCSQGNIVPTAATAQPANKNHPVRVNRGTEIFGFGAGETAAAGAGSPIVAVPLRLRSAFHCVPSQKRMMRSSAGSGYQPVAVFITCSFVPATPGRFRTMRYDKTARH
jgi:hypothetical protein